MQSLGSQMIDGVFPTAMSAAEKNFLGQRTMKELVAKARSLTDRHYHPMAEYKRTLKECADEIERLAEENARLHRDICAVNREHQ